MYQLFLLYKAHNFFNDKNHLYTQNIESHRLLFNKSIFTFYLSIRKIYLFKFNMKYDVLCCMLYSVCFMFYVVSL
jgi:hypothetical protein